MIYGTLDTTTYSSESAAMNACKNNDACKGISLVKKNTYKLGMLNDLKRGRSGVISYVKGDEILTSASECENSIISVADNLSLKYYGEISLDSTLITHAMTSESSSVKLKLIKPR